MAESTECDCGTGSRTGTSGRTRPSRPTMLAALGYASLDALTDAAVPGVDPARRRRSTLPAARSEVEAIAALRALADRNEVRTSLIGMGYSDTVTPAVIRRNVLENPAWYTAYTPYQPEISQGRLEALLDFQTMVADLTGMDLANASLLDEATAAAEAMAMCRRLAPKGGEVFFVDADCHPQTIAVVRGRAEPLGIEVVVGDPERDLPGAPDVRRAPAVPGLERRGARPRRRSSRASHDEGALVAVATDLLALTLLRSPGAIGADLVVGSAQRFGVPLGFGGPHAAFLACRDAHKRTLPGRLVGVSVDRAGRPRAAARAPDARAAHPAREGDEQHLHRAGAARGDRRPLRGVPRTRGPARDRDAGARTHERPRGGAARGAGVEVVNDIWFDTLTVRVPGARPRCSRPRRAAGINLRPVDADTVGIALDETTTPAVVDAVLRRVRRRPRDGGGGESADPGRAGAHRAVPHARGVPPVPLRDRDAALPAPARRPRPRARPHDDPAGLVHDEAERDHRDGADHLARVRRRSTRTRRSTRPRATRELVADLEDWLCAVTGYDAVSLQPNAGSQGELAGLLAIRAFHRAQRRRRSATSA